MGNMVGLGCTFNLRISIVFIYLGHIFISNAYEDKRKGDRYAAILTLLGIVNLPIIKWSVEWWNTLHQPASISKFSSPSIDPSMMLPLFLMVFSFLFFFISLVLLRIKGEVISRKLEILEQNRVNMEVFLNFLNSKEHFYYVIFLLCCIFCLA